MIIEFNAFKNCTSLKEIHFEKLDKPVNTNIYSCNIPNDLKIIVKDKLYKDFLNVEIPANHHKLMVQSEYIKQKIEKTKYYNIILSIIYIQKVVDLEIDQQLSNILKTLISKLQEIFKIANETVNYIKYNLDKIEEYQNE